MNQRNIFIAIAIVLFAWGTTFYLMGDKVITDTFENLSEAGIFAAKVNAQLASVMLIIISLLVFVSRNNPKATVYFTIGASLLVCMTLKHMFIDGVYVPYFALITQIVIAISSGYLWYKARIKTSSSNTIKSRIAA